jgi:hypothetical protein
LSPAPPTDDVLHLLSAAIMRRLRQQGRAPATLDPDADLVERGLIDSQALLDIILEVEERSRRQFDASLMDFDRGITLRWLAAAFTEAG